MKKSRSNNTIRCPLCKEVSPVPSGGLKTIKYNKFLADLVKRMDAIEVESSHGGVESTNKDIKLSDVAPFYCKAHPRHKVDQYCVDCDCAGCATCLLRYHRHHNLVDIAEQANICNKQLQHIMKQISTMMQLIDKKIDDSNTHDKQSTTDIKNIKKQINKVIDEMIDKLNKQRSQLITSLDNIYKQKEKVMMTVRGGQNYSKAAVTSLRSYTDNILRHGRDYDRIQQVRDIHSQLASVSKARIPSFVWSYIETRASSHDMTVARVNMKTDVMEIEGMGGHMRGSVAGAGSVSDNIVAKIPMIEQGRGVTCLEVMGQIVWAVHYGGSSLYAYSMTSPHQPQTFSIQGLFDPRYMVRFPSGLSQLVISDLNNNQLVWVKVEQRNGVWRVTSQRSVEVSYGPRGLGVHDNQLLVCDRDDNCIHVLSTSGEETYRVNMPQGVRPEKAVSQLISSGFVIRDFYNNQVVLATEKGEIQHTYRGQEGFDPWDIVCHSCSIYITDHHNHQVHELSDDGRHVRHLISEQGLREPRRMCGEDTGRLYVAQGRRGTYEVWVIETSVTPSDTHATSGDRVLTQQTNMNLSVTWCD